jgi:hypothetical protein
MEGTCGRGNLPDRLSGVTPRTSDSAWDAGSGRSSASGGARASPGCRRNPMGAAGLVEIRWFPGWWKTLWRRLRSIMVRPGAEERAREGTSGGESLCDGPGMMCSEGGLGGSGTTAVEPGRTGSSASEPAELPTSYSSEFEIEGHRGRGGARAAATHPGPSVRKSLTRRTPGAAADPASPQGGRESNPPRG